MEDDRWFHPSEGAPDPGSDYYDDDSATGTRRRPSWVRALALALAAVLVLSTVGTVSLVLLRRSARVNCAASVLGELDLIGATVSEARRTLTRAPYRCERDTTIEIAVADLVDCDRDRPGTIVRQDRIDYDPEGKPFVTVAVCGSVSSA
ncbi:MAG: hypothetical protein U0U69_11605 [Acidimicrobiia bacterium]